MAEEKDVPHDSQLELVAGLRELIEVLTRTRSAGLEPTKEQTDIVEEYEHRTEQLRGPGPGALREAENNPSTIAQSFPNPPKWAIDRQEAQQRQEA